MPVATSSRRCAEPRNLQTCLKSYVLQCDCLLVLIDSTLYDEDYLTTDSVAVVVIYFIFSKLLKVTLHNYNALDSASQIVVCQELL